MADNSRKLTPEEIARTKKWMHVCKLACMAIDPLVDKFFDYESEEMLDEKIEVLTALIENRPVSDKDYYKILENYPDPAKRDKRIILDLWD